MTMNRMFTLTACAHFRVHRKSEEEATVRMDAATRREEAATRREEAAKDRMESSTEFVTKA